MPEAYRTFAFSAGIGELSPPLVDPTGQGANYVVRVIDRQDQALRPEQEPLYKSEIYRQWLTDTQAKIRIIDKWTMDSDAHASAAEPLIQDLVDRSHQPQEPQPQITVPIPTVEVTAGTTPATEGTPSAETPAAPGASPPAGTPANGQ
jgi:hypothetical protein